MNFHLQLELSLAGQPQIRRTLLVPEFLRLRDFSEVICTCFGWKHDEPGTFTGIFADALAMQNNLDKQHVKESKIPLDMPVFVYFANYTAPFYFQAVSAPFQKVVVTPLEKHLVHLKSTMQLLESSGENTPAADGTRTAFSAHAVNQQLTKLQKTLLPDKLPSPAQLLDESPAFKEELLNLLQAETSANGLPPIEVEDAELHQLLQQMANDLSETAKEAYSLHDCLTRATTSELKDIIRSHSITGYSKLHKAELVALLEQRLSNREFLRTFFSALSYEELNLLGYLCEQSVPIMPGNMQTFEYLLNNGICYMSPRFLVTLPIELRDALQELLLDVDFQHSIHKFDKVHRHCLFASYLYGIYPIDKLLQQIEDFDNLSITAEELHQITQCRVAQDQKYFFMHNSIAHGYLREDPQELQTLLQKKNRVYYQPDWDDQADFIDSDWLTNEGLYGEFEYTFSPYFQANPDTFWLFLHKLDLFMHTSIPFDTLVQLLCEDFFSFPDEQTKAEFTAMLQQLWNDTVRWNLDGYTRNKMPEYSGKHSNNKNNVISLNAYRQKK